MFNQVTISDLKLSDFRVILGSSEPVEMQYANSEVFSVSEPDHCDYTIKITEKDNPEIEMFPTVTFMDHEEFNKKIVIAGTTNADYPDSE